MLESILADLLAVLPPNTDILYSRCVSIWQMYPYYWHLAVKNSKFTFLLWEFILTDQLADLPADLLSQYWYLLVTMSSNLVDLPLDLPADLSPITDIEWWRIEIHISTVRVHIDRSTGRSTPQKTTTIAIHHGIYNMGCIWQPFWILEEKVGISFLFLNNEGSKQSVSIVEWCQM